MRTTFDDLLVESPLVKAEMDRLRELHGILERALRMSVAELREARGASVPDYVAESAVMEHFIRRATFAVV